MKIGNPLIETKILNCESSLNSAYNLEMMLPHNIRTSIQVDVWASTNPEDGESNADVEYTDIHSITIGTKKINIATLDDATKTQESILNLFGINFREEVLTKVHEWASGKNNQWFVYNALRKS